MPLHRNQSFYLASSLLHHAALLRGPGIFDSGRPHKWFYHTWRTRQYPAVFFRSATDTISALDGRICAVPMCGAKRSGFLQCTLLTPIWGWSPKSRSVGNRTARSPLLWYDSDCALLRVSREYIACLPAGSAPNPLYYLATPMSLLDSHTYYPPFPGDSRSPCPALNALANHGYM